MLGIEQPLEHHELGQFVGVEAHRALLRGGHAEEEPVQEALGLARVAAQILCQERADLSGDTERFHEFRRKLSNSVARDALVHRDLNGLPFRFSSAVARSCVNCSSVV